MVARNNNGEEVPIYGYMDTCTEPDTGEGLLAIASYDEVMAFDKKEWRTLVAPYEEDYEDDEVEDGDE